jgi:hypothetical protein
MRALVGKTKSARRVVGELWLTACRFGLEGALGGVSHILGDPTKADSGNHGVRGEALDTGFGVLEDKMNFDFSFMEP